MSDVKKKKKKKRITILLSSTRVCNLLMNRPEKSKRVTKYGNQHPKKKTARALHTSRYKLQHEDTSTPRSKAEPSPYSRIRVTTEFAFQLLLWNPCNSPVDSAPQIIDQSQQMWGHVLDSKLFSSFMTCCVAFLHSTHTASVHCVMYHGGSTGFDEWQVILCLAQVTT